MYNYCFYISAQTPSDHAESIEKLLEKVRIKHGIEYNKIQIENLAEREKQDLLESLRIVSRKNGKRVVSSGRGPLPISRSGQLGNIGILIQSENEKPVDVYPHVKNGKRIESIPHLKSLIKAENMEEVRDEETISEQDISRMITTLPELIEKDLQFLETEVETGGGRIDAVFKDKEDIHFLIEIELKANDNAIAQVQRFKIPYSKKFGISTDNIRLGIVCTDIGESRLMACKGAGIDVYKLDLQKLT